MMAEIVAFCCMDGPESGGVLHEEMSFGRDQMGYGVG